MEDGLKNPEGWPEQTLFGPPRVPSGPGAPNRPVGEVSTGPSDPSDEELAEVGTPAESLEKIRTKAGQVSTPPSEWPRRGFLLGFVAGCLAGVVLAVPFLDGVQAERGRPSDLLFAWTCGILLLGYFVGLLFCHATGRLEAALEGRGRPNPGVRKALALHTRERLARFATRVGGEGVQPPAGRMGPAAWVTRGGCVGAVVALVLGAAASLIIVFTDPTLLGLEFPQIVVRAVGLPPLLAVCLFLLVRGAGRVLDAWRHRLQRRASLPPASLGRPSAPSEANRDDLPAGFPPLPAP
jgi:hypothetical protein